MFAARNTMMTSQPPGTPGPVSASYTFTTKPAGMAEDASRAEMLPLQVVSGNCLRERAATGGSGAMYWWAQAPQSMATRHYRATATVGNSSASTDRGACVWVGGTDGAGNDGITNLVYMRYRGQSNAIVIGTKAGSTVTGRVTAAAGVVTAGDTISLEITESGGVFTYQGYKNGILVPSAVWTDTAGVAGVPGKAWGGGGYGVYSAGHYYSLGLYGMAAADI